MAIEELETTWDEYPVFHLDFNGQNFNQPYILDKALEDFVSSAEDVYGKDKFASTIGNRFKAVLAKAKAKFGRGAVVLIDEYDKPMLDVIDSEIIIEEGPNKVNLEDYNRNVLKGFYSVFKAADEHLQFVMLTGVTKFSQISVFSGFNQPNDISMTPKYEALCGITEDELKNYFSEPLSSLAETYKCTFEEMHRKFKDMYDGYHFSNNMLDIYNPFSVLNAFNSQNLGNFWFSSGSPTYLVRLMAHFNQNINEMLNEYYQVGQFIDYRADVEQPLPMIYQSGYLTIKDYDPDMNEYLLGFPNKEVEKGFIAVLAAGYFNSHENPQAWSSKVVRAMKKGDTELLRKLMTSFLASIPYTQRRKDNERELERYFHYTFYLILRMISIYTIFTEKHQSEGRVDCVVETPSYIYIFEFKLDGTAKDAIDQINRCGYAREYESDPHKLFKIGCNFSSKTGTINDWIVEELNK